MRWIFGTIVYSTLAMLPGSKTNPRRFFSSL
jgi:hypothetical protein